MGSRRIVALLLLRRRLRVPGTCIIYGDDLVGQRHSVIFNGYPCVRYYYAET